MKYKQLEKLSPAHFRRRTGVEKKTFNTMVALVTEAEMGRKKLSGRPQKLSYEDHVLMSLEYLREYRTLAIKKTSHLKNSDCHRS